MRLFHMTSGVWVVRLDEPRNGRHLFRARTRIGALFAAGLAAWRDSKYTVQNYSENEGERNGPHPYWYKKPPEWFATFPRQPSAAELLDSRRLVPGAD